MNGTKMDPRSGCKCISDTEYKMIFPDWATQKDVDFSYSLMWDAFSYVEYPEPLPLPPPEYEKPSHWPDCAKAAYDEGCNLFNELACTCFAEV